jgi:Family of unknown function (DUF6511)
MICPVCRREARWWAWFDTRFGISDPRRDRSRRRLCSCRCQDICHRRHGMVDPTEHEVAAMRAASPVAGEYIESLGKTDLAAFAEDEWLTLIEVIVTAYTDALRDRADQQGKVEAPPW